MLKSIEINNYKIREIEAKDNASVEKLIRTCLIEFGGNREGTAWCDPDLGRFSEIYNAPRRKYWVVEDKDGKVIAGSGIGPLTDDVCELQKMYCYKEHRGTGIAQYLMNLCLSFAKKHYNKCYLETFNNMIAANRFYQKNGFVDLKEHASLVKNFS